MVSNMPRRPTAVPGGCGYFGGSVHRNLSQSSGWLLLTRMRALRHIGLSSQLTITTLAIYHESSMTQRRKRQRAKAIVLANRARSRARAALASEDLNGQLGIEFDALAMQTFEAPRPSAMRDPYIYLILILPVLVLLRNTNAIYSPAGYLDPWIYYGYMKHLVPFKTSLFPGTYYGSRLSWVLPGALVHSILRPVPANYVLHLTVFFTAVFSVYWLLKEAFDRRIAILSAICLALYPYFWAAVGWDYVDGAGIAYYLLAMALLFAAVSRKNNRNRWLLVGAGMAYAGLIYSNIVWMAFSPGFLGLYLWRAPGRLTTWKTVKHAFRFLLWFGIGLAVVSAILGVINWRLEGGIRFYSPSWNYAVSTVGTKNPWKAPDYSWLKIGYWLILPGLASFAALLTCITTSWRSIRGDMRLFFALNLLYCAGVLIYMEAAGRPALQLFYYASYLIPTSILVFGTELFQMTSSFRESRFLLMVGSAVLALLCIWVAMATPIAINFVLRHAVALIFAGMGMAVGGILLRRRTFGAALGLAGLTLFSTSSRALNMPGTDEGANSFKRISSGMEAVEYARGDQPVRFWFNQGDPYSAEFHSLNSCYLWGYTYINFRFPILENAALSEGTFIVVPSSKADVAREAAGAIASQGATLRFLGRQRIESGGKGFWLHFFRVEPDSSRLVPLQISFDSAGIGILETPPEATDPASFPRDRWTMSSTASGGGSLQRTPEGVLVESRPSESISTAIYSEVAAGKGALYRFTLRYRLLQGDPGFGALKEDRSGWFGQADHFYRSGQDTVKEFTVALGLNQRIWLATGSDPAPGAPSSYVIEDLRAYRFENPAPTH